MNTDLKDHLILTSPLRALIPNAMPSRISNSFLSFELRDKRKKTEEDLSLSLSLRPNPHTWNAGNPKKKEGMNGDDD
jgi:hypothetical protein